MTSKPFTCIFHCQSINYSHHHRLDEPSKSLNSKNPTEKKEDERRRKLESDLVLDAPLDGESVADEGALLDVDLELRAAEAAEEVPRVQLPGPGEGLPLDPGDDVAEEVRRRAPPRPWIYI